MFGQEHVVEWCELGFGFGGSQPDGERESRGPVGLGQGMCYQ